MDYATTGDFAFETSIPNSKIIIINGVGVQEQRFDSVPQGSYSISIKPNGNGKITSMTMQVKTKSPADEEPITTNCWSSVGQEDLDLTSNNPEKLVIYGQAIQGSNPVINASMKATITAQNNEETIELKDDGVSPDSIKNDGIYSGYYNAPNNNGKSRYSLVCKIEGTGLTKVVNDTQVNERQFGFRDKALPSHPTADSPICCGSIAVKVDICKE